MTLEINERNILGWLALMLKVIPMDKEDYIMVKRFLKRRDVVHRHKEIQKAFE